jgi:hypothetical protein
MVHLDLTPIYRDRGGQMIYNGWEVSAFDDEWVRSHTLMTPNANIYVDPALHPISQALGSS